MLTNLTSHLLTQHSHSSSAREVATVLNQLVLACKVISRDINKAGLVDILGSTGRTNVQAEEVQKLDEHANQLCVELLQQLPLVRAIGSEELAEIVDCHQHASTGKYIVFLDPLDGSGNIDVNINVGTIFSVYKLPSATTELSSAHYLLPAQNLVASGYVLYGPSTMLVYTTGQGVHGFTLDPSLGEFLLSHPHLKFAPIGSIYSINESYAPGWDAAVREYVRQSKTSENLLDKPKNALYVGALVADFHRNLIKSGLYLYPATASYPIGKLRLVFEAIPLAFLAHQAGGGASTGRQAILKLTPDQLHQRTPLFIGSHQEVIQVEKLYQTLLPAH